MEFVKQNNVILTIIYWIIVRAVMTGTLTNSGMNIRDVHVYMQQIKVKGYCRTRSKFCD
jgi:hypothetical protein